MVLEAGLEIGLEVFGLPELQALPIFWEVEAQAEVLASMYLQKSLYSADSSLPPQVMVR